MISAYGHNESWAAGGAVVSRGLIPSSASSAIAGYALPEGTAIFLSGDRSLFCAIRKRQTQLTTRAEPTRCSSAIAAIGPSAELRAKPSSPGFYWRRPIVPHTWRRLRPNGIVGWEVPADARLNFFRKLAASRAQLVGEG